MQYSIHSTVIILFVLGALIADAEFDQGGVVGTITFARLENGSTQINTSFTSGNFSGWHVHNFPADYTDDPAVRCQNSGTGPHYDPNSRNQGGNYTTDCAGNSSLCEAGDLSGKFGALQLGENSFIDNDPLLQLTGQYGIIGRSVVIHKSGGARIACANIILRNDSPRIFVATFVGPVAGTVYFRQSQARPEVGTFIHAKLFYTGTILNTIGHLWRIHNGSLVRLHFFSNWACEALSVQSCSCLPLNIITCHVNSLVLLFPFCFTWLNIL